jgi:hypothetical protein
VRVFNRRAGVAQLVEQLIRNQQVRGSTPRAGSILIGGFFIGAVRWETRRLFFKL